MQNLPAPYILISIHTPHVGSDAKQGGRDRHQRISIHTPHVGSDRSGFVRVLPLLHFNPHSPCGERPCHGIITAF